VEDVRAKGLIVIAPTWRAACPAAAEIGTDPVQAGVMAVSWPSPTRQVRHHAPAPIVGAATLHCVLERAESRRAPERRRLCPEFIPPAPRRAWR
jgi:hypothetical protein